MTTAIVASNARFRYECPTVLPNMEETREGVAVAESRFVGHRGIGLVFLLVAWLCAHPSEVVASCLRTDEGCCLVRKAERGSLVENRYATRFILIGGVRASEGIFVCNIIIAHLHGDGHRVGGFLGR